MNQLNLIDSQTLTMSSREVADLTKKRHDSVKRTIDTLAEKRTIQLPQIVEVTNHLGQTVIEYRLDKRSSLIVVAQLSPEFTARLVDRWQELEDQAKNPAQQTRVSAPTHLKTLYAYFYTPGRPYSQTDFAKRMGVAPNYLWRIIHGQKKPRLAMVMRMVDASYGALKPWDILPDGPWGELMAATGGESPKFPAPAETKLPLPDRVDFNFRNEVIQRCAELVTAKLFQGGEIGLETMVRSLARG